MNFPRKVHSRMQTYFSGPVTMKSLDFIVKIVSAAKPDSPPTKKTNENKTKKNNNKTNDKILHL